MECPSFISVYAPRSYRESNNYATNLSTTKTLFWSPNQRRFERPTIRRPRCRKVLKDLLLSGSDFQITKGSLDGVSPESKPRTLTHAERELFTQSFHSLREKANYLDKEAIESLHRALEVAFAAHSGQLRRSGEPFITHPVAVALLLAELRMDVDTLIAGLLHDTVEDTDLTLDAVESLFGHVVRNIVESETKVSKIARKMKPSNAVSGANGALMAPVSMIAAAASAAAAAATAAAAAVRSKFKGLRLDHDLAGGEEIDASTLDQNFEIRATVANGAVTEHSPNGAAPNFRKSSKEEQQAEYIRRMFVSMAEDIRVIVVKLADRLHNMRTLEHMPPLKQQSIAQETLGIFVPLAHRLGLARIASELEDLSFRFLHPKEYGLLSEQVRIYKDRTNLEMNLAHAADALVDSLENDSILKPLVREICTKVALKNLFSIYQRILQGARLENIHDLATVQIIVGLSEEHYDPSFGRNICYHILGRVHSLFRPFPGHVKDFVAYPKPNGYQSLHTLVLLGPKGGFHPVEVQIFTDSMHVQAEYGIAMEFWPETRLRSGQQAAGNGTLHSPQNHWQKHSEDWLRNILEYCKEYSGNSKDCVDAVQKDLLGNRVYVFTPKNYILDLPKGSTVVDAAYHIHSDVGNQMIGARVAGRFVPLDYELSNADSIKIITSPAAPGPSREWLRYARSRTAKQKIRRFLRSREVKEACERGRELLQAAARHLCVDENEIPNDLVLESALPILVPKVCAPARALEIRCLEDLLVYVHRFGGLTAAAKILCHFCRDIDPDRIRTLEELHTTAASNNDVHAAADTGVPDTEIDGTFAEEETSPLYLRSSARDPPANYQTLEAAEFPEKDAERYLERSLPERERQPGTDSSSSRTLSSGASNAAEACEDIHPECFAACCCNPVPGDRIVAIRIRPASHGVPAAFEVHRLRCVRCLASLRGDPEACVSVRWCAPRSRYPVRLALMARDGPGLLSRIAGTISSEGISIVGSSSRISRDTAILFFEILVQDKYQIERLRTRLLAFEDVLETCRVRDHLGGNETHAMSSYAQTLARLKSGEVEILSMAGSLLEHEVEDADNEDE
jgi:(p)ppGpp synthase/HD superfamily hydrolase